MIKPLHDQVLIKLEKKEDVTKSGIIITRTKEDNLEPDRGEVVAVGPGRIGYNGELIPTDIKIGDKVLFAKYAGHLIKEKDEELVLVGEKDIIAVFE